MFGFEGVEKIFRNMILAIRGFASDIGSATATAGAATLSDTVGTIRTDASSAAADATYTLTLTDDKIAAGDIAFASVHLVSGTAESVAVKDVVCAAGTLTIVLMNSHNANAWSSAVFDISFVVVKALSGV